MSECQTDRLKAELARYSARIVARGLAVGPGGNMSARDGAVMWISPSGYALDDIDDGDWVPVEIASGRPLQASPRPSSEVSMHLAIYRERPDVAAAETMLRRRADMQDGLAIELRGVAGTDREDATGGQIAVTRLTL